MLCLLAGFDAFDALYTGRRLSFDKVVELLIDTAERTLCRQPAAQSSEGRARNSSVGR